MSEEERDPLPWSEEAEQSVLGGLLLDNSAWDRVADLLSGASFYNACHGMIYEAIGALVNSLKPADVITVYSQLKAKKQHEACGGMVYLNTLCSSVPSAANARRYAEIVAEKWQARALIAFADRAAGWARSELPMAEKLTRIASGLGGIENRNVAQVPVSMGEIVIDVIDHTNDMHERGDEPRGMTTRLPSLDTLLGGGFQEGLVYLLGARPGMGKSSLALWWMTLLALHEGVSAEYLSQEMGKRELGQRACALAGQVSYTALRAGKLDGDEWSRLSSAVERLGKADMHIDEQAGLTGGDIRIKARYVKGLKLLVLDYVQLCKGGDEQGNTRNEELEAISRGLKVMGKELKCATIVLSALNRKVDERPRRRPIMSDFKDCGALEADADVIFTLFPARWEIQNGCRLMGMDILKQRQGATGELCLNFWPDLMSWGESEYTLDELFKPDRTKKGEF